MPQFDVSVQIFEQFEDVVSSERLRSVSEFVLAREEAPDNQSLSIVVVSSVLFILKSLGWQGHPRFMRLLTT